MQNRRLWCNELKVRVREESLGLTSLEKTDQLKARGFMSKKAWCDIVISKKKVKIDREDKVRVEEKSWRVTAGETGRLRVVTSVRTPEGVRSMTLGKFLMKPAKGKQVYPRRFNEGLDYRKDNLVVCTLKERQRLLPKQRSDTTSDYRGVSLQKASKKWRAGIEINGKAINLGEFKSEHDAAIAYNKAALKYFGKIAYQNSISRKNSRK